jgi:hypothetical protein
MQRTLFSTLPPTKEKESYQYQPTLRQCTLLYGAFCLVWRGGVQSAERRAADR